MFNLTNKNIVDNIINANTEFVVYLPCSKIAPIIHLLEKTKMKIIPIGNETEGIGICTGLHTTGKKALLLIQDAGLIHTNSPWRQPVGCSEFLYQYHRHQ